MNSITRNTSFDSLDATNGSSFYTEQPVIQAQVNKLPHILFADWLISLEEPRRVTWTPKCSMQR